MKIRARDVGVALVVAVVALEPLVFLGSFAGDAQVHLVFAESASHGRPYEFNVGERVSGETSPGYMLLGAALFRILPARDVPVALKLIGMLAWYGLCLAVFRVARRWWPDSPQTDSKWVFIGAALAAVLPGSVYNANVGMENGLFAAGVWWWIDRAAQHGWFDDTPVGGRSSLWPMVLAILLGLLSWLRPEGAIVVILALVTRAKQSSDRRSRILLEAVCAVVAAGSATLFQHHLTGDWIATSILSRRLAALQQSFFLGPLALDPTFAKRLLLYAPLTMLYLVRRRRFDSPVARFCRHLLTTTFVFYTLGGGPHLARYAMFVLPVLALGAAAGARMLWESSVATTRRAVVVTALGVYVSTCAIETVYRRAQYSQGLLTLAMNAPANRTRRTVEILARRSTQTPLPLVLATEAVQQRYELDPRIIIRSIDGRTDRSIFRFVQGKNVDEASYLRSVGAQLLDGLRFPDVDRPASLGDLLRRSPVGSTTTTAGLSFTRLDSFTYSISTLP